MAKSRGQRTRGHAISGPLEQEIEVLKCQVSRYLRVLRSRDKVRSRSTTRVVQGATTQECCRHLSIGMKAKKIGIDMDELDGVDGIQIPHGCASEVKYQQ